jgi:apolipoprotein N-acyltransferase
VLSRGLANGLNLALVGILGCLFGLSFAMPPSWGIALGFDWTNHAWWLQLIIMMLVLHLGPCGASAQSWKTRAAWGWWFSLCWFTSALAWLTVSMHVYGGMPAWMAGLALVAFSAYLALYPALAFALMWTPAPIAVRALLTFGAWVGFEWLRGWVFTGFPWASPGYAQIDGPLAALAPVFGVYALGAAAWLVALLIHEAWRVQLKPQRFGLAALAILILGTGFGLKHIAWTQPAGEPLRIALLQGQVPQNLKFDHSAVELTMTRYAQGIAEQAARHDLIVLPETAWTQLWKDTPPDTANIVNRTGATVALGAPDIVNGSITNSVLILKSGELLGRYDKHHLVPFGEFIPFGFRWFVELMKIPLGDFARGRIDQESFMLKDQRVAFNICYEDLFGEEIVQSVRSAKGATLLVNMSNLAWFGHSHALPQHLQISRTRALEAGRPMLRATNTGATASINAKGEVKALLPFTQADVLSVTVEGSTGLTPFARWGNAAALVLAAACLVIATIIRKRVRRPIQS